MSNLVEWDRGDAPRLSNTFLIGTTATDPTTVTLEVTDPSGVLSSYTYPATVVKDATGVYHKDVPVNQAGEWHYRFIGTGTVEAVAQRRFAVRRTGT